VWVTSIGLGFAGASAILIGAWVVVDMLLVGWCSWTLGISVKARCSRPLVMVGRI
jgi:hypothetical protein